MHTNERNAIRATVIAKINETLAQAKREAEIEGGCVTCAYRGAMLALVDIARDNEIEGEDSVYYAMMNTYATNALELARNMICA